MARQAKKIRERGKLGLSSYFKNIDIGTSVALVTNAGIRSSFSSRINGMSGKVIGSRGQFKLVEIKDGNKEKTIIVHPVHLKKL